MELEKSALKKSRNVRVHVEEKLFLLRDVAPNCQLFVSVAFSRRERPPFSAFCCIFVQHEMLWTLHVQVSRSMIYFNIVSQFLCLHIRWWICYHRNLTCLKFLTHKSLNFLNVPPKFSKQRELMFIEIQLISQMSCSQSYVLIGGIDELTNGCCDHWYAMSWCKEEIDVKERKTKLRSCIRFLYN